MKNRAISTHGNFVLWAVDPIYKTYVAGNGRYVRNTNTGMDCGDRVDLYKRYYKDGRFLTEPEYDEDCYEVVTREGGQCKNS